MEDSRTSRVTYDMPEEELSYFGSRAKASPAFAPAAPVRLTSDRATPACNHEKGRLVQQRTVSQASTQSDAAPQSNLADRFQRYVANKPQEESQSSSFREQTGRTAARTRDAVVAEMPSSAVASQASSVRRRQLPVESKHSVQQPSRHGQPTGPDDFYWSHDGVPESGVSTPRQPTVSNASRETQRAARTLDVAAASASQNSYEQPRGDQHAPMRKNSHAGSAAEPRDFASQSSASVASYEESANAAPPHAAQPQPPAARSAVPRQQAAIAPVRQAASESRAERQQHPREQTPSEIRRQEYEQMRDDEENCTFHPRTNNPSRSRRGNVRESPYRGSEGTNPPRTSYGEHEQDLYDKLHGDAEAARCSSEGRRAQREADNAESERSAAQGPRSASANRRQSVGDRHVDPEQVFSRLYLDAQRYNREKAEQERLLEQRRQEERTDGPFDWNKGKDPKEAEESDEKTAPKRSESALRRKSTAVPDIFLRLSRPSAVTMKFEKQKEQAEQEKREKEQRDAEQKRHDMEKIAGYNWAIPAKSFTFADMESQNLLYVS